MNVPENLIVNSYNYMKKYLLIFFLFALSLAVSKFYQKVIHNTDPEAKCLDGSPGFIYVHEGGDT